MRLRNRSKIQHNPYRRGVSRLQKGGRLTGSDTIQCGSCSCRESPEERGKGRLSHVEPPQPKGGLFLKAREEQVKDTAGVTVHGSQREGKESVLPARSQRAGQAGEKLWSDHNGPSVPPK